MKFSQVILLACVGASTIVSAAPTRGHALEHANKALDVADKAVTLLDNQRRQAKRETAKVIVARDFDGLEARSPRGGGGRGGGVGHAANKALDTANNLFGSPSQSSSTSGAINTPDDVLLLGRRHEGLETRSPRGGGGRGGGIGHAANKALDTANNLFGTPSQSSSPSGAVNTPDDVLLLGRRQNRRGAADLVAARDFDDDLAMEARSPSGHGFHTVNKALDVADKALNVFDNRDLGDDIDIRDLYDGLAARGIDDDLDLRDMEDGIEARDFNDLLTTARDFADVLEARGGVTTLVTDGIKLLGKIFHHKHKPKVDVCRQHEQQQQSSQQLPSRTC
ncbi:hypothetical protein H0H92_009876 [Tricholoma furcatifolium]|nr:hypothetical protein H0H92_009876 [Tricholoma furcatifolium]